MMQCLSVTSMPLAGTLSALINVHVKLDLLETEKHVQVRLVINEGISQGLLLFKAKVRLSDNILIR